MNAAISFLFPQKHAPPLNSAPSRAMGILVSVAVFVVGTLVVEPRLFCPSVLVIVSALVTLCALWLPATRYQVISQRIRKEIALNERSSKKPVDILVQPVVATTDLSKELHAPRRKMDGEAVRRPPPRPVLETPGSLRHRKEFEKFFIIWIVGQVIFVAASALYVTVQIGFEWRNTDGQCVPLATTLLSRPIISVWNIGCFLASIGFWHYVVYFHVAKVKDN